MSSKPLKSKQGNKKNNSKPLKSLARSVVWRPGLGMLLLLLSLAILAAQHIDAGLQLPDYVLVAVPKAVDFNLFNVFRKFLHSCSYYKRWEMMQQIYDFLSVGGKKQSLF